MPRTSRDTDFSAFVAEHRVELLRAARLLTAGDRHLAEDLVQTALVQLYVAWPRLRDKPVAYAHRVIINAHIDMTRRPWWRRERSVPELPDPVAPPTGDTAGSDDLRETIRAALATLPPRMRAVIVIRHWLGLSVEECADLLGCTPGTVKSQSARAMVRLRDRLGPESLGDPPTKPPVDCDRLTVIL